MRTEQKEQLSLLMDDQLTDQQIMDEISKDVSLQSCWHRYHIVRDVMRGALHSSSLTLDISNQVAQAVANENLYDQLDNQPNPNQVSIPKTESLLWIRIKDVISKVGQVGLAACVTLAIIAGVQYQQGKSESNHGVPTLNTVPFGVNVAPVGGIQQSNEQLLLEKRQYDKIRLLVQDYELQKRLNAR
ncbi:hypothetical protein A9G34_08205 [Gilliamella sp. Choc4-2]|jgi:sigma-E factor negative regulatory protein RseA|uniref:RseA family anti-sigma factor n=1 Tax=unclassified Gilliamella TaxID=2685620 RepID=UPI0004DD2FA8|nr:RseA family anti-sigma factor [Gilliamella apicola]KFA59655.1 Sigma factor RpoE negative regulatory protein RseA [Gilliamella apicola]OCG30070.1 hypothetical protein A9G33_09455 [Gilliamella apicola]OCG43578.1 hypothetical protein A9G34_08205 [Gilliamella apicola]OCG53543.1 hypothetical protein A9G36_01810 [Gilliamella apicola]OCG64478.1 hypothetical protein A9G48_02225 [Gilliamella apicola]